MSTLCHYIIQEWTMFRRINQYYSDETSVVANLLLTIAINLFLATVQRHKKI